MTRRGLFSLLRGAPAEPVAAPVEVARPRRVFPVHRPPGAVAEADFLDHCTRCGECLKACPHQAIVLAPARFREAEGTPMIVAADNPCQYCLDTPCASVCLPRVLRSDYPGKMGTARVERMDCLAWQRSFCTVCEERCPVPGAISLDLGKPGVDASACVGCGICLSVCPAPRKAIVLTPEVNRPAWRPADHD